MGPTHIPGLIDLDLDKLIESIMARATAGSGAAIFVDPVVLRQLILQACIVE